MRLEASYVGPGILRADVATHRKWKAASHKKGLLVIVAVLLLMSSAFAYIASIPKSNSSQALSVTTIPLVLSCQHYDTLMPCIALPIHAVGPHAWNDAKGLDGIYGNADDCPHCSAYCAPASISMIATYRGIGMPGNLQDAIYDNGKSVPPELTASNVLETH